MVPGPPAGRQGPGLHLLGAAGRRALGGDDPGGDRGRDAHPHLLGVVHVARGSGRVRPLLRLPEPVRGGHADAGPGGLAGAHLRRVGGRRALQLPAHRLLVHRSAEGLRRPEGLRGEPDRRLRVPARGLLAHRALRDHQLPRPAAPGPGRPAAVRGDGGDPGGPLRRLDLPGRPHLRAPVPVRGRGRQERPASPLRLAPGRHGGPDARVRPHPRRHHGHGRRLPGGAATPISSPWRRRRWRWWRWWAP